MKITNKEKPTDVWVTSDRKQAVKLRIGKGGKDGIEALSIPANFGRTVDKYGNVPAMKYKRGSTEWQSVTYSQYREKSLHIAKAFIKLGLEAHNSVGILAFNSPEWFYSELGAIHAGGIVAGIYTTNSPESVYHVLHSSHANIVVVDDSKQMEKIRQIRHRLPLLKAAIQIDAPYEPWVKREDGYYRWSELEEMNLDEYNDTLQERLDNIHINECAVLVYTSGTVGQPKGAMLSHDSITWNSAVVGSRLNDIKYGSEVLVSYLPLSHIAAQLVDIHVSITFAATVYFADKDALRGTLVNTLREAQPTRFVAVPRVYEKIYEKMMEIGAKTTGIKRVIADWAKGVTLEHWLNVIDGKPAESYQYKFVRQFVMSKIKEGLGFGQCSIFASAAAPMSSDLKRYFMSVDLPIVEAFGMSESSGAQCFGGPDDFNLDSIGRPLPGTETLIINKDENGHGEILMKGRHIFMGYIDEPEKTAETIDDEGWLHSGDIGYLDAKGFLYITGRLKELIITAGGENIPPVHIEHLVKNELSTVSNAFLIGDKRKYLTMLISLKTQMDLDSGAPKDELHPETIAWCKSLGVEYTKLTEIIAAGPCPKVFKAISDGIARANKNAISNAQKIQKFAILPHDFSVPTGELGPTLKVKRNIVVQKYAEVIENLYA